MLPENSHGVAGSSEPTARLLDYWPPGDERVSPEQGRRTVPGIGVFLEDQGRFNKEELLRPGMF